MPNAYDPDWDVEQDAPPYTWRRARLGRQAGAEQLGASLFELPPGAATFPLHAHLNNEELLIVLDGTPELESPGGSRELARGEVVACPAGPRGVHRVTNRGERPARVLIVSTMRAPDVNLFPETGEYWVRDYVPGTEPPADAIDVRLRA